MFRFTRCVRGGWLPRDRVARDPDRRRDFVLVRDEAAKLAGEIAELRHAIHREPEIGLDLPKTQRKVLDALSGLPLEISTGKAVSSVTAVLRGGRPGPVVLLRGDMDALPVTEETGLPYASAIPGAMHACGHDLHTAMLAGAAKLLSARQAEVPGTVIFMFQPGEEGYAGAQYMIGEGVLAEALQHEQDHLDGKVYLQRLEPDVRREAMAAVRRAPWF